MDKLTCMRAYCQVVKAGSFSAAARELNLSKVLVSRYVSELEADLGVRLLQRTTRKMSVTAEGQAYFERSLVVLQDVTELEDAIKNKTGAITGRLRLAAPTEAFSVEHLMPLVGEFAQAHPSVEFDIEMSDRYTDIVDEGYDLAIRIGKLKDSSLVARKLADMQVILCASPQYLACNAPISAPEDLNTHTHIVDSNFLNGANWPFKQQETLVNIKPQPAFLINNSPSARALLLQGLGVGVCPSFTVREQLQTGKLVQLLPDWELSKGGIYVVYSHRKHLSAKVSGFVDALVEHFSQRIC
ncbi:LysR family transcriptional regulator [Saccharophagus degradans]|uniref:LysR family transcriptional regulator n=1 Tax=Saccharophagus degradans TaxID=86304 RepID=UPI001C08D643|nr:LysR family transcriptional regulator [Saccharophagus degradans]MBU2985319.1 LysR family transcriptional regulator [Saccharophagus degradans]